RGARREAGATEAAEDRGRGRRRRLRADDDRRRVEAGLGTQVDADRGPRERPPLVRRRSGGGERLADALRGRLELEAAAGHVLQDLVGRRLLAFRPEL